MPLAAWRAHRPPQTRRPGTLAHEVTDEMFNQTSVTPGTELRSRDDRAMTILEYTVSAIAILAAILLAGLR
jgi:hypothetical protein